VVSHEELWREVSPNVCVVPGAMKSAVHALRRALGAVGRDGGRGQEGCWIKTVHGYGYRFVGEVQVVERATWSAYTSSAAAQRLRLDLWGRRRGGPAPHTFARYAPCARHLVPLAGARPAPS
jgi:hypothetical protein